MMVGLFGYGSLLLKSSFERTLGHPYSGEVAEASLRGWRRRWNVAAPNQEFRYYSSEGVATMPERILYLNAARDAGCELNGVVYAIPEEALAAFDQREFVYDRILVTEEMTGWTPRFPVYLYTAKREAIDEADGNPQRLALRLSYLEIVRNGLAVRSEEFRAQYARSTDAPPADIVVTDFRRT